jgi:hypothetical protein
MVLQQAVQSGEGQHPAAQSPAAPDAKLAAGGVDTRTGVDQHIDGPRVHERELVKINDDGLSRSRGLGESLLQDWNGDVVDLADGCDHDGLGVGRVIVMRSGGGCAEEGGVGMEGTKASSGAP